MLPNFSDEHEMFRDTLRDFVEREVKPYVLEWEMEGAVPRALFEQMGELGFLGVRLPTEYGGGGLDFWYTTILIQELMRGGTIGVPVAVMAHAEFATMLISRGGSDRVKKEFLHDATAGRKIGALGVSEPNAGSDVAAISTRAVRDGDDYIVNGSKTFITNGTIADYITTAVRTGGPGYGGISLLVIPADTPGLSRKRLRKIGTHASDTAEIAFEDCRVPADNLLGGENGGFKLIMQGFEGERLVLSIIASMQMRLMSEVARDYGHERKVFGQHLLEFQVWQHRLADVFTKVEAAETLAYRAIDLYVRGEPCDRIVSMAKLFACENALDVARECAQIFGGMSHMEECVMARLYRDSLALTIGAGSSEVMRELIARSSGLVPEKKKA